MDSCGRRWKRPSSARRTIKQETYSSFASCSRLRAVQSVLKQHSNLDGILCIQGIDSRYNDGCRQLINYLLFGFYELRRVDLESSGYPDEITDDLMLLVCRDCVHVYCNPILYVYLLPYVSHWRDLTLHCLTDHEYQDDDDVAEEFKIKSLVAMVSQYAVIGIPVSSTGQPQVFDKMTIEKWPIVQAFAVEGYGGGTFFTMKHQVLDVSELMFPLYSTLDPVVLEAIVTEQLPSLEHQWQTMVSLIDIESPANRRCLSEANVSEPLVSYFKHGRASVKDTSIISHLPFVLIGNNSTKINLESATKGENSAQSKNEHIPVTIQVLNCQAVAPKGPVVCARTYFLGTGSSSNSANAVSEKPETDAESIGRLYLALSDAVLLAIQIYSQTLNVTKAKDVALQHVRQKYGGFEDDPITQHIHKREAIQFQLTQQDNKGRCHTVDDNKPLSLVKTITMAIYDIPSPESAGQSFGCLLFAESFVHSMLQIKRTDGSMKADVDHLVLTSHIHRAITWQAQDCEAPADNRDTDAKQPLLSGDNVLLSTTAAVSQTPLEVAVKLYPNAVCIKSTQFGDVLISLECVKSLQLYTGDGPNSIATLIIHYTKLYGYTLPCELRASDNTLMLAFVPRSKSYKDFFSEVFPVWRNPEYSGLKLETAQVLMTSIKVKCDAVQQFYNTQSMPDSKSTSPLRKASRHLPHIYRFMSHLSASCTAVTHVCDSDTDLPTLLQDDVDKDTDSDKIIVTIVSGVPGSYKENLCVTLTSLSKEQNRWILFKQPLDSCSNFNPGVLQKSLSSAVNNVRRRRTSASFSNKTTRILVITPGFTDVIDVVQAIAQHPDPDVTSAIKIGAVTCCIDPHNMFMEHRMTLPAVLNHCSEGWVNNVLFTSGTLLDKDNALSEAQELIRAINPNTAFILAERGEVTRSTDVELILSSTAFSEKSLVRMRELLTPNWMSLESVEAGSPFPMVEVILRFNQSLDRHKTVAKLRGLKGSLVGFPHQGNVYHVHGRTRFTDSTQLTELRYTTLSNTLQLVTADVQPTPPDIADTSPTRNGHSYFVVFTGRGLEEETLKAWLRGCRKDMPVKRDICNRSDLSKEQITEIHNVHHLDALPEGWFYNGHQFISMGGERVDKHPDLEKFIIAHLENVNNKIKEHNAEIDASTVRDLFD